jgi:hypothetical protein
MKAIMKEIDFLPAWYKSKRRQQITYHTQYVALTGMFVLMMVSNFVTGRSVSRAQAQFGSVQSMEASAKDVSAEYGRISGQIAALKKKTDVLKQIDSRINVGDVLAELSFLMNKKTVLTKVELIAEKFQNQQSSDVMGGFSVRPAGTDASGKEGLLLGDVRFKVVLGGVAAGASGVGEFISRLEDSPYFCRVYPSFTRNKLIKFGSSTSGAIQNSERITRGEEEGLGVSEFEISCYLENFKEN